MADIGYLCLAISLVLAAYSSIIYFIAGKTKSLNLYTSAQRAAYAVFGLVTLSSLALYYSLYTRDFQVHYVAQYSNSTLSWFYTGAAFWAGQAGSLLFWAWLLTIFSIIVIVQNRNRNKELLPYTMGVISVTTFFFIYLLVFKSNPFEKLPYIPPDGNGLNPLLQNIEMIFHPPALYVGFVGLTIPFAFAIAALLSKKLEDQWIKSIRKWTLFSWLFLTIGNILGMQWAYVELGWGGYWAWDPVENSSLLPWLTCTAFLHSIIVQERKGMLKIWNISLIALSFALTIFGTFVTRSGLISSVHAFGVSDLGPLFLGFLALILVSSFGLLYSRRKLLNSRLKMGSWSSKESSFLLNNILFMAITIGVFLGTIMPTITEAIKGEKITVGADFFNRMATPIGMAIFLLIGVCALLSWRKTNLRDLLKNLAIPGFISLVTLSLFLLKGIRQPMPLIALEIAIFAASTVLTDYIKSALLRSRMENKSFLSTLVSLTLRNKRRYGGAIVHLGMLMFFLGIIGSSAFSIEKTATLRKGGNLEIGRYNLHYLGLTNQHTPHHHIDAANFEIFNSSKKIGTIRAEKHFHENFQPATEVGIHSTLADDLYIILANYDKKSELATVSVMVNYLVLWIWIGGIVMVLGTILAMLPRSIK